MSVRSGLRRPAALLPIAAAAAAAVLLSPSSSRAANKTWVGPNGGSWNTAANWSPSGVPSSATTDNVTITPTPIGDYALTLNTNYPTTSLGTVTLNSPNAFRLTLNHASASFTLRAAVEVIGSSGNATYNHSAGSNVVNSLFVGDSAGGIGTYSLSGTGSLTATTVANIGYAGTGSVSQTGGTASLGLTLGNLAGSAGTYSLSGTGSLSSSSPAVGLAGTGSFVQTGGTHTVTGRLSIGYVAGSSGTYRLSGGTLSASSVDVSFDGTASFVQTGGSASVGSMSVGVFGDGSYSLSQTPFSSSTLTATGIYLGGDGFEPGGTGHLSISSGTATVTGTLRIWDTPGSSASLTGGSLTVANLDTSSDPSRFSWTGGTLAFSNGYTLDSAFALGPSVTVGSAMTLAAGAASTNNGALTLNGGTLSSAATLTNNSLLAGYGTLAQPVTNTAGGNVQVAAGLPLTLAAALSNAGTVQLNSGTITGTGALTNTGLLSGPGAVAVPLTNTGTIVAPAGSLTLPSFTNAGLITLDSAAAQLTGGPIANAGTLQGRGRVNANVTNTGAIEPVGGVLQLAGSLANPAGGTLRVGTGNKLLITGSFPTSAGSILLTGGTLDTNGQPLTVTGSIIGNGALAGGTLTNAGSVLLAGGPSVVSAPVVNTAAHTFTVQNTPALFTSPVTNNGTFKILNTTATFAGGFSGSAPSAPGSLTVDAAGSLLGNSITNTAVTNDGAIALRPASQGGATSTVTSLSLGVASTFDVADNDLFVDYSSTSPAATIRQYLLQSHLLSSTANADAQHRLALGYGDAPAFAGAPSVPAFPDATSLVVTLTYFGDANLDGKVNADDFALIDRAYAKALPNATWTDGDFNYDGVITALDYLLIDRVYVQQGAPLSPEFLAQRESQFGADYVSQLLTSIPEPSSLACLFAGLLPVARRRRRAR